jgi:hypothetical protein
MGFIPSYPHSIPIIRKFIMFIVLYPQVLLVQPLFRPFLEFGCVLMDINRIPLSTHYYSIIRSLLKHEFLDSIFLIFLLQSYYDHITIHYCWLNPIIIPLSHQSLVTNSSFFNVGYASLYNLYDFFYPHKTVLMWYSYYNPIKIQWSSQLQCHETQEERGGARLWAFHVQYESANVTTFGLHCVLVPRRGLYQRKEHCEMLHKPEMEMLWTYMYNYVYIYICISICTYISIHQYIYLYIYIGHTHIYIYVHIHIYICL